MNVTLNLPPDLIEAAEREAARQGTALSRLGEAALRQLLAQSPPKSTSFTIPVHDLGRPRVDIANRDALHDAMEEDD